MWILIKKYIFYLFCYLNVIAIVEIPSGTLNPKEIATGTCWILFLFNWTLYFPVCTLLIVIKSNSIFWSMPLLQ